MQATIVIAAARRLLTDAAKTRWSDPELLAWLNAAQRQVVMLRPDAHSGRITIDLQEGVEQTIPASAVALLSVLHNVNADDVPGRPVTLIPRDDLNNARPGWTASAASTIARHYVFDPDTPRVFEVWPPAAAGARVRASVSLLPQDCASLTSDLGVPDLYESALTDLVCFRCYMEDSEDAGDSTRAQNHLAAAMQALQVKTSTDEATRPKRK